ncbi:MAG: uracil-DNA glycosylase [Phycisphaeraceae bacterium]
MPDRNLVGQPAAQQPGPIMTAGDELGSELPQPPTYPKVLTSKEKKRTLEEMDTNEVRPCNKCVLCETRTQTVFGNGDPDAKLLFIGEGPGEQEDLQGVPFVGKAGQKLTEMIKAMGLSRETVFIANVVKCRPPGNRTPLTGEIEACWDYLLRQIATIQPHVIVTLGGPATKTLLQTQRGITSIRGIWHHFNGLKPQGPAVPVMPTFHPAYLLRAYTPENRKKVWSDLQAVMKLLQTHK